MNLGTLFVGDTDQQLIDVHAHFLTESYVDAARAAGHVRPDGMAGWPKWCGRRASAADGPLGRGHRNAVDFLARYLLWR